MLVLGLGNALLRDDGSGLEILRGLERQSARWRGEVELVDGGTQGLNLLGLLEGRQAAVILDAVALGSPPGTLHVLCGPELLDQAPPAGGSAHEGNAGDLLRAAALVGSLPPDLAVVGVEPGIVRTGMGFSAAVEGAIPGAVEAAAAIVTRFAKQRG